MPKPKCLPGETRYQCNARLHHERQAASAAKYEAAQKSIKRQIAKRAREMRAANKERKYLDTITSVMMVP